MCGVIRKEFNMKLCKATKCLQQLNRIFERPIEDFNFANDLCDVLSEIENQENKYNKLKSNIINEFYEPCDENDNYLIKNKENIPIAYKKLSELDELEFKIEKYTSNKPVNISPRELQYLREFFIFE